MSEAVATTPTQPEGWRAGFQDALSAVGPALAEFLIKAQGKPVPDSNEAKADAAGPMLEVAQQAYGTAWDDLRKASQSPTFREAESTSTAVVNDPYAAMLNTLIPGGVGGITNRNSQVGWALLARTARTPLIAAIQKVLLDQLSEFCSVSDNDYQPGFKVRLRNRRQAGTPVSARMCRKFETFISQLGYVSDRRQLLTRPSFRDFTVAVWRDSLTYDQATIETIPTVSLDADGPRPGRLRWTDASTIRLSEQALNPYGLPDDDYTTPRYVQVVNGQPVAEFNPQQMYFGVRNATTSIYQCGYGISEIEMMMSVIAAWINAFARNAKYFDQGFGGRGFLVNKSEEVINPQQMNNLKSDLQAFLTGVQGSHRIGILQTPMDFLTLGNEVQDRQWGDWSDLQVKLACALYGVEPASINHVFGNQGQSSAMGSVRTSEREDTTRKRGLLPKVRTWFDWLNRAVIWQYDADFEIVPTGIETDEAGALELSTKRLAFSTFNEVRATYDLPAREDGDVIGSTVGLQAAQMIAAKEAEPDEPAEALDIGSLFGGEDIAGRSSAEVEDAGQAPRDDGLPLQASRRSVAGPLRLRFDL